MGLLDKLKGAKAGHRVVIKVKRGALGKDANRILKRPGIAVERARNLKQAVTRSTSDPPPALTLLQAERLDDPALEACETIRRSENPPPVVVMYPRDLLGLRDAAIAAGAHDVLPVDPSVETFERIVLQVAGISSRKHPRVPVAFQVRVHQGTETRTAYAENLSMGGIQIRADREVGIGTPVRLDLAWPGQPLTVWALGTGAIRVRKAVVTGMRFIGLSAVEIARLEAYLAARGGVTVNDPYEALAAPSRLEVADVIRLASGVDAGSSQSTRQQAMRFTNSERHALTGMGGEASDAEPLIHMAVARLKAAQFTQELEKFDLSAKEAQEYAQRVATNIASDFLYAQRVFQKFSGKRIGDASPQLTADLRAIENANKRISQRLATALEQLNPTLAEQIQQATNQG